MSRDSCRNMREQIPAGRRKKRVSKASTPYWVLIYDCRIHTPTAAKPLEIGRYSVFPGSFKAVAHCSSCPHPAGTPFVRTQNGRNMVDFRAEPIQKRLAPPQTSLLAESRNPASSCLVCCSHHFTLPFSRDRVYYRLRLKLQPHHFTRLADPEDIVETTGFLIFFYFFLLRVALPPALDYTSA